MLKSPLTSVHNQKPKKCHFPAPPISNLPLGNIFLQFKTCKSVEIDAIGIYVAQQIKLSDSLTRGHSTVKNAFLPLLAVKYPFVEQPDNSIC